MCLSLADWILEQNPDQGTSRLTQSPDREISPAWAEMASTHLTEHPTAVPSKKHIHDRLSRHRRAGVNSFGGPSHAPHASHREGLSAHQVGDPSGEWMRLVALP